MTALVSSKQAGRRVKRRQDTNGGETITVSCCCCKEKLSIFMPAPAGFVHRTGYLEIGGVSASIEEWRQIFGPLLGFCPDWEG